MTNEGHTHNSKLTDELIGVVCKEPVDEVDGRELSAKGWSHVERVEFVECSGKLDWLSDERGLLGTHLLSNNFLSLDFQVIVKSWVDVNGRGSHGDIWVLIFCKILC